MMAKIKNDQSAYKTRAVIGGSKRNVSGQLAPREAKAHAEKLIALMAESSTFYIDLWAKKS
jgi:hypothetical protein